MEKLKDILYDLSDVIISLVIIAVIFIVVSWKLNDAMPLDSTFFTEQSTAEASATFASTDETVSIVMTEAITTTAEPASEVNTTAPVATTAVATNPPGVVSKTITIRSGSSGNVIAKQLKDAGIIKDTTEFLKVVDKLGVGTRLQVGSFKLSSDMSYEQIARKLSGQ